MTYYQLVKFSLTGRITNFDESLRITEFIKEPFFLIREKTILAIAKRHINNG